MISFIFDTEELDEHYKKHYGFDRLFEKSNCRMEIKYNNLKMIQLFFPKYNKNRDDIILGKKNYNESEMLSFINDIKNNIKTSYNFNSWKGIQKIEYENNMLRISNTEDTELSNLFVEYNIENIDELCDEFHKFNNWIMENKNNFQLF